MLCMKLVIIMCAIYCILLKYNSVISYHLIKRNKIRLVTSKINNWNNLNNLNNC